MTAPCLFTEKELDNLSPINLVKASTIGRLLEIAKRVAKAQEALKDAEDYELCEVGMLKKNHPDKAEINERYAAELRALISTEEKRNE